MTEIRLPMNPVSSDAVLVCPQCGNNYVHLTGARILLGGHSAEAKGNTITSTAEHNPNRGSAVTVTVACESGCQRTTDVTLRFHKGMVYLTTVDSGESPLKLGIGDTALWQRGHTLWRD